MLKMEENGKSTAPKRPNPTSTSDSALTKKRKPVQMQRSMTDSDIELMEAADDLDPPAGKKLSQSKCGLVRHKTAPVDDLVASAVNQQHQPANIPQKTLDQLPAEILQEIFCRLPAIDLVHFGSVVCKKINGVILDETYLPWKKLYAKYLRRQNDAVAKIEGEIRAEIIASSDALDAEGIIKYMAKGPPLNDQEIAAALKRLALHPCYEAAASKVKTMFQTVGDQISVGALVATMVLLSDEVETMYKIVHLLTAQPAFCNMIYWIEYFYCLLTLLQLYTHLNVLKDGRLHYQLKYALYLLENGREKSFSRPPERNQAATTATGQRQASSNMQPTYEQYRIINYDLKPGDYVRIVAFAGTGKTTTLLKYCEARPHQRFLVVFYNRDVADDAERRFPSNATCINIHRLAFEQEGRKYKAAGKLGDIHVDVILEKCPDLPGLGRYVRGGLVKKTLNNFLASDREDISSILVPEQWKTRDKVSGFRETIEISLDMRVQIAKQAERMWELMKDLKKKYVRMPHDGYLKLYQLSKPILKWRNWRDSRPYDAILVDEAQDCNPAALDIFKRQTVPKIMVGDGYQQIYQFRGAINALDNVPSTKTFFLTQSFRFGPQIAYVANAWMRSVLDERKKFLIGTDKPSRLNGKPDGQVAIICRTNCQVFKECVHIAETERGRQCLAVGTARYPFDFDTLEVLYYLSLSDKSRHDLTAKQRDHWCLKKKKFPNLEAAKNFAESVNDFELLSKINIVEHYKTNTRQKILEVKECFAPDSSKADFVVMTAHKSKGLEFQTVRLADDFRDFNDHRYQHLVNEEEDDVRNLLYVALTRAMSSLIVNEVVQRALEEQLGPMFYSPHIPAPESATRCGRCNRILSSDQAKFMHRKQIAVTGRVRAEEITCKDCVAHLLGITAYQHNNTPEGQAAAAAFYGMQKVYKFFLPLLQ